MKTNINGGVFVHHSFVAGIAASRANVVSGSCATADAVYVAVLAFTIFFIFVGWAFGNAEWAILEVLAGGAIVWTRTVAGRSTLFMATLAFVFFSTI